MKDLNTILLMAGRGERFKQNNCSIIKPLLKVEGKPLYQHALKSVDLLNMNYNLISAVLKENLQEIKNSFKRECRSSRFFSFSKVTRGPLETAFVTASSFENPENPLLILDCDLLVRSSQLKTLIQSHCMGKTSLFDGGLVYFNSNLPRYSYLSVSSGKVTQVVEKNVISSSAVAGLYYLKSTQLLLEHAGEILKSESNMDRGEFYISKLFQYLIENNHSFQAISSDEHISMGTPTEIKERGFSTIPAHI